MIPPGIRHTSVTCYHFPMIIPNTLPTLCVPVALKDVVAFLTISCLPYGFCSLFTRDACASFFALNVHCCLSFWFVIEILFFIIPSFLHFFFWLVASTVSFHQHEQIILSLQFPIVLALLLLLSPFSVPQVNSFPHSHLTSLTSLSVLFWIDDL